MCFCAFARTPNPGKGLEELIAKVASNLPALTGSVSGQAQKVSNGPMFSSLLGWVSPGGWEPLPLRPRCEREGSC